MMIDFIIETIIVLFPGILLAYALFPREYSITEKVIFALFLGLPTLGMAMLYLNLIFGVKISTNSSLVLAISLSIISMIIFLKRRKSI